MHPEILSITLFGIVAAFTPGPNNFAKQKEKNEKNNNRATSLKRPAEKLHRGPVSKHAAMAKVRKV